MDRTVFVKRDDHTCLYLDDKAGKGTRTSICGNKARKFAYLASIPEAKFPPVVVSYGGVQSNAMLALGKLVALRGSTLVYFTQSIPETLRDNPR